MRPLPEGSQAPHAPRSAALWRGMSETGPISGGFISALLVAGLIAVALLSAIDLRALSAVPAHRLLLLLVVAPVVEESVFRAGLQELLRRLGSVSVHAPVIAFWPSRAIGSELGANLFTALAFGASHALLQGAWTGFAVVLPALVIGAVYARTGRLRHCVALHAASNLLWLIAGSAGIVPHVLA
ncbi:hypothetical protein BH11PSE8_BH11PSE8_00260 [soil metagenome]